MRNQLAPGTEGGYTTYLGDAGRRQRRRPRCSASEATPVMSIYDAAMLYQKSGIPLIVLAGKEYGSGSSRDWAAKGTMLLGVKAVIAESFERIHRSNLVNMGVLPLEFKRGESVASLALTGREVFDLVGSGVALGAARRRRSARDRRVGQRQDVRRDRAHRHARGADVILATAASCRTCCRQLVKKG